MPASAALVTGTERTFDRHEIIVSKTDPRGRITYVNRVFVRISGFSEAETIGRPHSMVRHPAMPRCVFKLLWDTVQGGREIFAYVVNRCKNGDHYWVLAHVTPTFDDAGKIVGYHSNRRVPERDGRRQAEELYRDLLAEERRAADPREGMEASLRLLERRLEEAKVTYDEFVFSFQH